MIPPCSDRIARVPPYSRMRPLSTRTGLSPAMATLSRVFRFLRSHHWPGPRSLATTSGVSVDVLSSRYLDVSVPWVRLKPPMYSEISYLLLITRNPKPRGSVWTFLSNPKTQGLGVLAIEGGFPHSEIRGSKLLRSSSRLIAA